MKTTFAGLLGFAVATNCFVTAPARAALNLVIEQATPGSVAAGAVVPVNVLLRGTRTTAINSVQLSFSPLTGGATFSTATVADGFDESPLAGQLSNTIDGSLINNLTLAYGKDTSGTDTGIPAGSADARLGTFYLQTPAEGGSYPLSLASWELSDPSYSVVNVTPVVATVVATVPEPGAVLVAGLWVTWAVSKRRSRRTIAAR